MGLAGCGDGRVKEPLRNGVFDRDAMDSLFDDIGEILLGEDCGPADSFAKKGPPLEFGDSAPSMPSSLVRDASSPIPPERCSPSP